MFTHETAPDAEGRKARQMGESYVKQGAETGRVNSLVLMLFLISYWFILFYFSFFYYYYLNFFSTICVLIIVIAFVLQFFSFITCAIFSNVSRFLKCYVKFFEF